MDRNYYIDQLERHIEVYRGFFKDMDPSESRWKSSPEKWCALEIICHLYDEEREDFRARLRSVLETPEQPFVKIDPPAWIAERKYIEQEVGTMLEKFLQERLNSVAWLRGLKDPPWSNAYIHPKVGPVNCDLLLTNWVAHDLHHFRQLINLRYGYIAAHTAVPLDYAGKW